MSLRLTAYGEFDCEFDYDSQEWSCSQTYIAVEAGDLVSRLDVTQRDHGSLLPMVDRDELAGRVAI